MVLVHLVLNSFEVTGPSAHDKQQLNYPTLCFKKVLFPVKGSDPAPDISCPSKYELYLQFLNTNFSPIFFSRANGYYPTNFAWF